MHNVNSRVWEYHAMLMQFRKAHVFSSALYSHFFTGDNFFMQDNSDIDLLGNLSRGFDLYETLSPTKGACVAYKTE